VQVICDGIHVSPVMIDILHRTLGDRVVLVTDHMPAADPGYHIEGGVMRAADGTIAGSALFIDEALRNYMSYAQIPFAQAIVAATHAPARLIRHDGEMGRITRGARADLSFWDKEYDVLATMVGGRFVYNRLEVAV
jgi:N-acetylglucosamine-6-phosphate deacetylase